MQIYNPGINDEVRIILQCNFPKRGEVVFVALRQNYVMWPFDEYVVSVWKLKPKIK